MPFKTAAELIREAKSRIREVTVQELAAALDGPDAPVLLDVREPQETNLGRLPGALVLARGNLETKIEALIPREAKVVIYCASGNRSAFAADTMQQMGYADVASLAGGWNAWLRIGGPVEG